MNVEEFNPITQLTPWKASRSSPWSNPTGQSSKACEKCNRQTSITNFLTTAFKSAVNVVFTNFYLKMKTKMQLSITPSTVVTVPYYTVQPGVLLRCIKNTFVPSNRQKARNGIH